MGGRETPMLGLVTLGQGFFILILISVMYMILLCKEKRMLRQITPLMSTYTWQRTRIVTRQLNITTGAILVSKFIGWLPIMIMVMLRPTPYAVPMLDYCGRITLHSFSVMTPIAYGLVSSRYRRFLRQKTEEISARMRSLSEYCGSHICRCHCCGHSNSQQAAASLKGDCISAEKHLQLVCWPWQHNDSIITSLQIGYLHSTKKYYELICAAMLRYLLHRFHEFPLCWQQYFTFNVSLNLENDSTIFKGLVSLSFLNRRMSSFTSTNFQGFFWSAQIGLQWHK